MARIAGINIPNHQHADVALTAIYGIGHARAEAICKAAGVIGTRKMKDLSDAEVDRLREAVDDGLGHRPDRRARVPGRANP